MPLTADDIKGRVEKNGDRYVEHYGPSRIAGTLIWQVWVEFYNKTEGLWEYETRFIEEVPNGEPILHEGFQVLAVQLDSQHEEVAKQLEELQWTRANQLAETQSKNRLKEQQVTSEIQGRQVALFAAVACCVIVMSTVAFIIWSGKTDSRLLWLAGFLMASSVASSIAFLFGKFISIKLPW